MRMIVSSSWKNQRKLWSSLLVKDAGGSVKGCDFACKHAPHLVSRDGFVNTRRLDDLIGAALTSFSPGLLPVKESASELPKASVGQGLLLSWKDPDMTPYKFSVGEDVTLVRQRSHAAVAVFHILRQLPTDTLERQYRVRSSDERHERVVSERQIKSLETNWPDGNGAGTH
jgi:hypothetical protein